MSRGDASLNTDRLRAMLELAGRDTTPDGEAVNALRTVRRLLAAEGVGFADLLSSHGGGDRGGTAAAWAELVAAERDLRRAAGVSWLAATKRLEADISRLERKAAKPEGTNRGLSRRLAEAEGTNRDLSERLTKAEGTNRDLSAAGPAHATAAKRSRADRRAAEAMVGVPGGLGAAAAASDLNARSVPAPRGGAWTPRQVRRAKARAAALPASGDGGSA